MHRASAPFAATGLLAEEFAHHLTGRNSGTEGVDVIAVGAAEPVVLTLHGADHSRAHGLLTVVEVHEAKHLAAVVHLRALVLEASSEGHVAVKRQSGVPVDAGSLSCHQGREPFCMRTKQRLSVGGGGAARLRADCDVLTHGTTCLTTDFKGPWRMDGQNP
ncbi:MAG: Uncharacterised protein [Cyanobium sp. ARS6]|nr:MAG: Uncharacterised protein [Cyanobium sp. ARS6]